MCRLRDTVKKELILCNASTLAKLGLDKVRIHPDLTNYERKQHKDLVDKAMKMNQTAKNELQPDQVFKVVGRRGAARIQKVKKRGE